MRISHKYKYIFFSNPKTGSETIRFLLDPYSEIHDVVYKKRTKDNPFYSHITPQEVKQIFLQKGWDFDKYFKFTFVRNPWARLVSLYEMIKSKSKVDSFPVWLKTIKPGGSGGGGREHERWKTYGTYSIENYIKDDNGNILVDKIIRLEDIDRDLLPTLKLIGIPNPEQLDIPKINTNKNKTKAYLQYYDDETRNYVEEVYQYDIANFNYVFGE